MLRRLRKSTRSQIKKHTDSGRSTKSQMSNELIMFVFTTWMSAFRKYMYVFMNLCKLYF